LSFFAYKYMLEAARNCI